MKKSNAQKQKEYRERKKVTAMPKELIDLGRRYGEDEANRRGETGKKKEERIARAIRYQQFLWERDGASSG